MTFKQANDAAATAAFAIYNSVGKLSSTVEVLLGELATKDEEIKNLKAEIVRLTPKADPEKVAAPATA